MEPPASQLKKIPVGSDLRESTKIIIENYNQYHLVKEQLISLQEWITKQEKNTNEK
jgi:hypothetical protein